MLTQRQPARRALRYLVATWRLGVALTPLLWLVCGGCTWCGAFVVTFVVRGQVVDSETTDVLAGVPIDVRLLKDGEFIGFASGTASRRGSFKTPLPLVTDPDGSFALTMTNGEREGGLGCPVTSSATSEILTPDQLRITVSHEGCRQELFIDLNEDTVVDLDFPDDVIDLKDPILVPPCEQ